MSREILAKLQPLQKNSGRRINRVVLAYVKGGSVQNKLVDVVQYANSDWRARPINGATSLTKAANIHHERRIRTFKDADASLINKLNTELLGGRDYPVLTFALGVAGGMVSGGGSLLFSAATTALSLGKKAANALARTGDEIWRIEEIGKEGNEAVHVMAYMLVDPYRKQAPTKGWLIHEERTPLVLDGSKGVFGR